MLSSTFHELALRYFDDVSLAEAQWRELEAAYSSAGRHYHTLTHLEKLLEELLQVKSLIRDWDCLLFSLFYHDATYDPLRHDNEEQSAQLAVQQLTGLSFPRERIAACSQMILATKNHILSPNQDTNFFTDADLSVLGSPPDVYNCYTDQVRAEYSIYPDALYLPGRAQVLRHFLSMDRIFKTAFFFEKYEQQARENISSELARLS